MKARQQFAALAAAVMVGLAAAGATADRIDIPTGFPDETTTGIAGVGLTLGDLTPSGGMTITTDGMVIENMYITGGLNIKANNVTVRNTYIDAGTPPAGPFYGINASFGYTGTLIEDVTVIGGRSKSVYGGNMTVRRVNLSGGLDTLHVQSNVLVEDSYLHDLFQLPGSHNDGIQSTGGSNVTIRGNTIQALYQQQTSAIIIQSNFSPVDNVLIENNFLSGGTYTVYVRDKGNGHGVPTNVVIRDNVWEHEGWKFGLISADGGDHITYTGNTFHTGALIPQNADEGDGEDPPYESPDLPPADGPVTSSSAFQSFGIGTQTAPFTLTFDATPHNDNMNGVVGVLRGEAEDWSDIASLLRFFTNGQIEVRDGGDYGNDVA
ncbi:MAG: right-handed parallel beta-helix repeat-containing protein, partial [Phycisphaeraceae bacterium]